MTTKKETVAKKEEVKIEDMPSYVRLMLAQGEMDGLLRKDAEGQIGKRKYSYATLDMIIDTIRPVLSKYFLFVTHSVNYYTDSNVHVVRTIVVDALSGEQLTSAEMGFKEQEDAQAFGSYRTYMARYGLSSVLALSFDQDDDGEATKGKKKAKKTEAQSSDRDDEIKKGPSRPGTFDVRPISAKIIKDESPQWCLYGIVHENKNGAQFEFVTFDAGVYEACQKAIESGSSIELTFTENKGGKIAATSIA